MQINDYKYKAKRMKDGKIIKGSTEGPSKAIVDQFLFEQGLRAIEIERYSSLIGRLNRITLNSVIKERDLIFYLRQMGSLLRSGVKLNEACEILASQQTNKNVRRILFGVYYSVNGGQTLSDAFKEYPREFPRILVAMVAVGEKTGDLDEVIQDTVDYFEQQYRLKTSIRSTMMMPMIYLIVAVVVAIFLMVGVMPQFEGMYDTVGGELPAMTRIFMNTGNFMRDNVLYLLGGIILFILGLRLLIKKVYKVQYLLSTIAIKLPIFGELTKLNNLSRIASTIAQLLKNHVPLQDSLETTYGILDNKVYHDRLVEAQKLVNGGDYMSKAFEHHYASEVVFTRMMAVGERTGDLGKMMGNLANFYDEDSDVKVERLKKALEPLLLIFIYALIVVMILAVMLPSLSLSDQL
ncbi:MAG: type II secretion system F family protein [Candidatus Izemoplasmataceae bacterium]